MKHYYYFDIFIIYLYLSTQLGAISSVGQQKSNRKDFPLEQQLFFGIFVGKLGILFFWCGGPVSDFWESSFGKCIKPARHTTENKTTVQD